MPHWLKSQNHPACVPRVAAPISKRRRGPVVPCSGTLVIEARALSFKVVGPYGSPQHHLFIPITAQRCNRMSYSSVWSVTKVGKAPVHLICVSVRPCPLSRVCPSYNQGAPSLTPLPLYDYDCDFNNELRQLTTSRIRSVSEATPGKARQSKEVDCKADRAE